MLKHISVSLFVLFHCLQMSGQIKGVVLSDKGTPLPYATVYVKNTTSGTSANGEGKYSLQLPEGSYELVFQFLGYEQKTLSLDYNGQSAKLDCVLSELSYEIGLVEINASAEDPAYAIIRKAIERRPFYRDYLESYETDVYIKGIFRVDEIPAFFMSNLEQADTEGLIDSTGKGILYLSESESKVYFQRPNKRKEQMISSKVSGDSRGFSFNRFGVIDFYANSIELGRPLVNPIGSNAFTHYRYRLDRSFYDDENRQINRIEVIPRNASGPVFSGYIYILEGRWLIHSVDLKLSGNAAKIEIIDTLRIKQQYIPADKTYWGLFSQILDFQVGIMGLKFSGNFTAITSNYQVNKVFDKGFFDKEVVVIEAGSNEKGDEYWDLKRPVPLSEEEQKDYQVKDSMAIIRASKPYMDSVDRRLNKFKFNNIISGYTYRNSYAERQYTASIHSDLFTAVQGFTAGLQGSFRQADKEKPGSVLETSAGYKYGFSDRQHYAYGEVYKRWNARDQSYLRIRGGHALSDLNPVNSVPNLYNASLLLFRKQSINRFYNSRFVQLETGREVGIGNFIRFYAKYDDRREAFNNSVFSFSRNEEDYAPNNDLGIDDRQVLLGDHRMLTYRLDFVWRPGVKYISYPDRRFYRRSAWPIFRLNYRGGIEPGRGVDFQQITAAVYKNNMFRSIFGSLSWHVEGGFFPLKPTYFHDYKHFIGGPILVLNPDDYLRGFKLLPVYNHSTGDRHLQGQLEWDDNSWLFDKIPGIKKLGWSLIYGGAHLYTPEMGNWTELSVGIDRIGVSFVRLLRLDFAWGFREGSYADFGIRIGSKIPIE